MNFFFAFSRQGFSVALEPVLELAFIDQAGLELTEMCLPLPPKCQDQSVCHPCLAEMILNNTILYS